MKRRITHEIHGATEMLDAANANLEGSRIIGSNLARSTFQDVGLQGARFDDISFEGARIANSNLMGLEIVDCNTRGMRIDGVAVDDLLRAWSQRSIAGPAAGARPQTKFDAEAHRALLGQVVDQLTKKSWFGKEGWEGAAWIFTKSPPIVASLQIAKKSWLNGDRQGVHFETFVGEKEARTRQVPVMLHLVHPPLIPGTRIKRKELSKRVVDASYDLISSWEGYRFRAGKYGVQPFTRFVTYDNASTLPAQLVSELARMCRHLGPIVDRALREVLAAEKRA